MLNELAKQYGPQGFKVVGVSMDDDGDLILMRAVSGSLQADISQLPKKGWRGGTVPASDTAGLEWDTSGYDLLWQRRQAGRTRARGGHAGRL